MNRYDLALAGLLAGTVPLAAQTEWQRQPLLEHVRYPSLAFDAQRDVAVVFGGLTRDDVGNDTWLWDRVSWQRAASAHQPPARYQAAMVFDGARGVVLLFGGRRADGAVLGDTWIWDGVDWTELAPPQAPAPRALAAMVFDGVRSSVLLFGGTSPTAPQLGDTWLWDGMTWTPVPAATQPPARAGSALACDTSRQRVVMFGGSCTAIGGPCYRNDTWEWDGANWSDRTPPYPAPRPAQRWSHGLAYDAARGRTVLFGGSNEPGHQENDTWLWDGSQWVEVLPDDRPVARLGFGCDYDPLAQKVLVFGGETTYWLASDLWGFDGAAWRRLAAPLQPPLQVFAAAEATAFDGDRGVVVWFGVSGGNGPMQTWEWNGERWQQRAVGDEPERSLDHRLQWLPSRNRVLLHQPWRSWAPEQTWEFDGARWALLTPAHRTDVRSGFALALDPHFDRLLLFGGRDAAGLRGSTWSFDGDDWQPVASAGPSPREGHAMALDAARGRVVLFGGDGGAALGDTWEWDGAVWSQRFPAASPAPRSGHVMGYDLGRRRIVLHGGRNPAGTLADTWEWDGSDWLQRATPTAPPRSGHSLAHDFRRGEAIAVGGGPGTWRYAPQSPASFAAFGNGCGGSVGMPAVTTSLGELPYTGGPFTVGFANLPGTLAFAALGFSATAWNGVPLPLDMAAFGYPGCELLVAAESVVVLPVTAGVATRTLVLPAEPTLVGVPFFAQALAFDPAGPLGLAMTPGGAGVVGGR